MDLNDKQSNIPDLHLSDVIEVIEEHVRTDTVQQMDGPPSNNGRRPITTPYIKIVEQPASKALRFRYECEGRSAGSIPGVNSTTENKTYPTIQIVGYKGRAVVVVSCVTKDRPFRPHPHNLVGRDNCKRGICTIEINNESMTASFQNLGIQCVKRKDIDEALKVREEIRVDPFRTGFSHKDNPTSIDLNAVRLCFQAFLGGTQKGKYSILEPIVSDPIYDKKAMSDLVICRLSDAAASVVGGREIILLCEKVTKDDIQIRFFEEKDGICTWEGYADFQPSDVHKQVAISFRTPKYKVMQIDGPINVWIQLKRPTDGMCSEARPFLFTPVDSGMSPQKYDRLPDKSFNDYWADDQPEEKVPLSVFDKNKDNEDEDIKVEIKDEPMEVNEDTCYDINKENNEDSISSSSEVMGEDLRGTYSSLQMAFKNPCSIPERCQSYEDVSILPPRPPSSSKPKFDTNTAPPLPPKRVKKNPRPTKYLPTVQEKPSKIKLLHKLLSMRKRSKSMCSSNSSINEPINDTPLTEAENYALYTSVAPHAAMSEFDESSMYYSTVEGGTVTSVK